MMPPIMKKHRWNFILGRARHYQRHVQQFLGIDTSSSRF